VYTYVEFEACEDIFSLVHSCVISRVVLRFLSVMSGCCGGIFSVQLIARSTRGVGCYESLGHVRAGGGQVDIGFAVCVPYGSPGCWRFSKILRGFVAAQRLLGVWLCVVALFLMSLN